MDIIICICVFIGYVYWIRGTCPDQVFSLLRFINLVAREAYIVFNDIWVVHGCHAGTWNILELFPAGFRGYSYQHSCGFYPINLPFGDVFLQTIYGDDLGMFTSMNHGG